MQGRIDGRLALAGVLVVLLFVAGAVGLSQSVSDEDSPPDAGSRPSIDQTPAEPENTSADAPANVPENIIVFVCDGMGYHHIDVASSYQHGTMNHGVRVDSESGEVEKIPGEPAQIYETFPQQHAVTTHAAGGSYDPLKAWSDFDYVKDGATDSAAAATAMSTGSKTTRGTLGLDADGAELEHIAERAKQLGKATGVITSVPFSHATPAGFVVHNEDRDNLHEIAEEMITESDTNVIFGAGHPYYDDDATRLDEPNFEYISENTLTPVLNGETPYVFIDEYDDFVELAEGDTPSHVLGIAQVAVTLQYERSGDRDVEPYEVPDNEGVPTLEEMTVAGLNILDDASGNGFFAMIEGGAVDWAGNDNDLGRLIEEQVDFNNAVAAAVDWVETNSSWDDTLVIVTSDHETGYLVGPGSDPDFHPIDSAPEGEMPQVEWESDEHTNSAVPVFAKGAGADRFDAHATATDPVRGSLIDNVDIGKVMFHQWSTDDPTG